MKNKKYLLLFLLLIPIIIIIGRSFALPSDGEVKTIEIQSDNYNNGGSFHIDKNAEWYESGKVKLTIDIKSIEKNDTKKYKDIVLLIDASNAMNEGKLERAKSDAISLVNTLLKDLHHRIALIVFDSTATIKSNFTNNKEELTSLIKNISKNNKPNYNSALLKLNELLKNYDEDDRDLIAVILTNGNTSLGTPNEVATYQMLKDKYKDIIINGIQYEDGVEVLSGIKNITDNQWISKQKEKKKDIRYHDDIQNNNQTSNTHENTHQSNGSGPQGTNVQQISNNQSNTSVTIDTESVIFDAIVNSKPYDKYMVVDTINNDYFNISSQDDITVSSGTIVLKEENGLQNVYWNLDGMLTGTTVKMEIIVNFKHNFLLRDGLYATNKGTVITSKLPGEEEVRTTTSNSPVLSNKYAVNYDFNKPADCTLEAISPESHFVYENVTKRDDVLYCKGYALKSWQLKDDDISNIVNKDIFVMPNHDVTLYAVWTKVELVKKMGGEVKETNRDTLMVQNDDSSYTFGKNINRSKFESITILNHIRVPENAIDSWDVSAEQSGTVLAWYTDEDENEMYELYIGSPGGVLANPDSSYAFYNFYYVKSVDFGYFDTSTATNMYCMMSYLGYYAYDGFTLDVSHWDTSNVTNIEFMFGCIGYYSRQPIVINANNWELSNVTDTEYVFYGIGEEATSTITINANNWKITPTTPLYGYELFDETFEYVGEYYATGITINVNNWTISNVYYARYAFEEFFSYCGYGSDLEYLNINMNDWTLSNFSDVYELFAYSFYYAGYYADVINIKMNNMKISNFTDGEYGFYYTFYCCGYNATTINIEMNNLDFTGMENFYYGFYYTCYDFGYYAETMNIQMRGWKFPNLGEYPYYYAYYFLYYSGYYASTYRIDVSNWDLSRVTSMYWYGGYFFYYGGYSATTFEIIGLDTWDVSTITDMTGLLSYISYNAETLNLGDLSSWDTSNVTNMSYFFEDTGYYSKNIIIEGLDNWDTSNVTDMSYMFYYAGYSLDTFNFDIDNWNTSNVTDMSYMFYSAGYYSKTFDIDISGWDTSNVTRMNDMFYDAGYNATTWSIGNLSNWNISNVINMDYMFEYAGYYATTWHDIGILNIYAPSIRSMFYYCPYAKATLNINVLPTMYNQIFIGAATVEGSGITVNYTSNVTNINDIIATKSSNSNIIKGELLE